MDAVRVEVDDLIQQSYVYLLTDPIGRTAPSLSGLATKLKTCAASAQIGRAVRNGSSLQQKEGATGVEATATGLSDPFRHPERNIELTTTLNLKVTFIQRWLNVDSNPSFFRQGRRPAASYKEIAVASGLFSGSLLTLFL